MRNFIKIVHKYDLQNIISLSIIQIVYLTELLSYI